MSEPSSPAQNPTPADPQSIPIEQALARLENIVHAMEKGDLPLENLIAHYEEGANLVKICQQRLAEAEQKIYVISQSLEGSVQAKEASPQQFLENRPSQRR